MAETFKRVIADLDLAPGTIYTVPAGTTALLLGVRVSNRTATAVTFNVTVNDGVNTRGLVGLNTPLPIGSSLEIGGESKIVMLAGDILAGNSSADGDAAIIVSFMEIT